MRTSDKGLGGLLTVAKLQHERMVISIHPDAAPFYTTVHVKMTVLEGLQALAQDKHQHVSVDRADRHMPTLMGRPGIEL